MSVLRFAGSYSRWGFGREERPQVSTRLPYEQCALIIALNKIISRSQPVKSGAATWPMKGRYLRTGMP